MAEKQVRICPNCGKVEENLGKMVCAVCRADLPTHFKKIEIPEKEEFGWYKVCPGCGAKNEVRYRGEIINSCKRCHDARISMLGEDAARREGAEEEKEKGKRKKFGKKSFKNRNVQEEVTETDEQKQLEEKPETKVEQMKILDKELEQKNSEKYEEPEAEKPAKLAEPIIRYVELKNMEDGKEIRIPRGSYMIGALGEIERDYFYHKDYVGREHMMIYVEEDSVQVMDNDSMNWTRLNGKRIKKDDGKKRIKTGDQLTLADLTFEVMICR